MEPICERKFSRYGLRLSVKVNDKKSRLLTTGSFSFFESCLVLFALSRVKPEAAKYQGTYGKESAHHDAVAYKEVLRPSEGIL